MAKISNQDRYPLQDEASLTDYVIGTDNSDSRRTRNFSVQSIVNLASGGGSSSVGLPYTYVDDAFPEDLTEGQFTTFTQGSSTLLDFHNTDANGQDNSAILADLRANSPLVTIAVSNTANSIYSYYALTNDPIIPTANVTSFSSEVIGTLTEGTFVDGESYNLTFQADLQGSTNLGFTASSRTLTSSSGNNVILPYATTSSAGLMPRLGRQVFTPTLTDAGGGGTYSFLNEGSFIERIGNMLFVYIGIRNINTTGSPSGILRLGGLPFTISDTVRYPMTVGAFSGGNVNFYSIISRTIGIVSTTKEIEFHIQTALDGSIGETVGTAGIMNSVTLTNGRIIVSGFIPINAGSPNFVL